MKNILVIAAVTLFSAILWVNESSREAITVFAQNLISQNSQTQTSSTGKNKRNAIVTLTADSRGHFTAQALVNGTHVSFLVDTGASIIFISRDEARRIGIDLNKIKYTNRAQTAGGTIKFAKVTLREISVGNIKIRNVDAAISQNNEISQNLLGMSFLKRIKGFEFKGSRLILRD